MNFVDEIKKTFRNNNAINKIIVINVIVFIGIGIINASIFLSGNNTQNVYSTIDSYMKWFELPASFITFLTRPWSIITYLFLHDPFSIFHILFNMLWLYWIGNILHEYLGNRKVYESYFGGGIFGGLLYMISYNVMPVLREQMPNTFALGASASVLSVIVSAATLLPEYGIGIMFLGIVRLKFIALFAIVLDLVSIPISNTGGHIAHIGGALFGFLYIKYIYGKIRFPEWLVSIFSRPKLKVHYSAKQKTTTESYEPSQEEIDLILDKISKSGYDSLSKKEKEILFKASKN